MDAYRFRLAGPGDVESIVAAGRDSLGRDYFYDSDVLHGYMRRQRDAIWCMDSVERKNRMVGFAILLALRSRTVEWIRSGQLVRGRDILDSDIESALDESDAMYVGMVQADRPDSPWLVQHFMRLALDFERRRRPQLLLARAGTSMGRTVMNRMGFEPFGDAPFIEATYTDRSSFVVEARRRGISWP